MELFVGDLVYLKISPMKEVMRFGFRSKISPRYVILYKIIGRVGLVAYCVQLQANLARVHKFHISMPRRV